MTDHEIFIEFIKYHTPDFLKTTEESNNYGFCRNRFCNNCAITEICQTISLPTIEKEIVLEYRKKYPENCI